MRFLKKNFKLWDFIDGSNYNQLVYMCTYINNSFDYHIINFII